MTTPKICLTLTAPTLAEDIALAQQYAPLVDLVELRADCLADPDPAGLASFPAAIPLPAILTVRRRADGGSFDGPDSDRLPLFAAAPAFDFVDFESDFDPPPDLLAAVTRSRTRVIRSRHVFAPSPANVAADPDALCRSPDEIPKIAFTPRALADVAALFRLASALPPRDRIYCAMGPMGLPSRILAARARSFLTYASPSELLANTASIGHLDPATLHDVYRFRSLTPSTALCGVTGWPLAVTSSPQIHRALCDRDGVDAVLLPLPTPDVADALSFAEALSFRGLAVTIPHKESLLPHLHAASPAVAAIGAANTVYWRNGHPIGENTDAPGFASALTAFLGRPSLAGLTAAVLGAGGAARAVVYALGTLGATTCVYARRPDRAAAVAAVAHCASASLDDLPNGPRPDLLVQCTSLGHGTSDPAADPIPRYRFAGTEALYDLVYQPPVTPLMARASAAGCRVENGLTMLRAQAALQHRLFHRLP